jgi:glucuronosyltransferase
MHDTTIKTFYLFQDLQKFIDEAPDGVIYFSMGSGLYTSDMPDSKIKQFNEVFSKQKQRILWKWEKDSLPGQAKNVKIGKWFPQSDILGGFKCLNEANFGNN